MDAKKANDGADLNSSNGSSAASDDSERLKKFEMVYGRFLKITLASGVVVWVDRIDITRTYRGMTAGLPGRSAVTAEIEVGKALVKNSFHGPEPVIVPPPLYDAESDNPILPALRFVAQISSQEQISQDGEWSWMNLIWFAEIDHEKTLQAYVEEALRHVDWKASAVPWSL